MPAPRLAVCCSGQGTNLQAVLDAIRRGRLRACVAVVICDNPQAFALERARRAGIPAVLIDPGGNASREAFDRKLARVVERFGAKWIMLAGFMRILSPWLVKRYRGRILNVHPALLPAFPGARAVRDALRHGVKVTGVTVHFVDEEVDQGPILLQGSVPVKDSDTEKTLLKRIHRLEHRLYPEALRRVLFGRVHIKGRKVASR